MLTCRQFLAALTDFPDETIDCDSHVRLERHLSECPNCWVVCDTTRKTRCFCRGMKPCSVPDDVHDRVMAAMQRKMAGLASAPLERVDASPAPNCAEIRCDLRTGRRESGSELIRAAANRE